MFTDKDRMDWLAARWPVTNMDIWDAGGGAVELALDNGTHARRILRAESVRACIDAAMVAEQNSAGGGQQ